MKKVYIAGKITGLSEEEYTKNFEDKKKELESKGYLVLVPTIFPKGFTQEEYLHMCFSLIDVCDTVYMLKNWGTSKGARTEHEYALRIDKEIKYECPLYVYKCFKSNNRKGSEVLIVAKNSIDALKFYQKYLYECNIPYGALSCKQMDLKESLNKVRKYYESLPYLLPEWVDTIMNNIDLNEYVSNNGTRPFILLNNHNLL